MDNDNLLKQIQHINTQQKYTKSLNKKQDELACFVFTYAQVLYPENPEPYENEILQKIQYNILYDVDEHLYIIPDNIQINSHNDFLNILFPFFSQVTVIVKLYEHLSFGKQMLNPYSPDRQKRDQLVRKFSDRFNVFDIPTNLLCRSLKDLLDKIQITVNGSCYFDESLYISSPQELLMLFFIKNQHMNKLLQRLYQLVLTYKKTENAYGNFKSKYHSSLTPKDSVHQKDYDAIRLAIGWPQIFCKADNVIKYNRNLFYRSFNSYKLLTPAILKGFWSQIGKDITNKECKMVWTYLNKYSPIKPSPIPHGPLCALLHAESINYYQMSYSVREKTWNMNLYNSYYNTDSCIPLRTWSDTDLKCLHKDRILLYLSEFCKNRKGLLFWSNYVCDYISHKKRPSLYILRAPKDSLEKILSITNELYLMPSYAEKECLVESINYNQYPLNMIFLSYTGNRNRHDEYIQKLLSEETIKISSPVPGIQIPYKNCASLLLIWENKYPDPEKIRQFCTFKNIPVYECDWSEFPSLSIPMTNDEITYFQWFLFFARNHIQKAIPGGKIHPDEVLTNFLTNYCTITGDSADYFPSENFYNQWVSDYFIEQNCEPIGYKRFNRFLKSYGEGLIVLKPLHKSKSSNVQHIFGLKFQKEKYLNTKDVRTSLASKKEEAFQRLLSELYALTGNEINLLYDTAIQSERTTE